MLPTVAVANDGARALLLLTLAAAVHSDDTNPCTHTADGFVRPRSPCGINGTCVKLATMSKFAPHQFEFSCTCHGNYAGDRCERCDHGYTFKSGCADMVREDESTAFVQWAAVIGAALMVASVVMLMITFQQKYRDDPGILYSKQVYAGNDEVVLMRSASSLIAPRKPKSRDVCYYCKKPGHWKINCPLLAEHNRENGGVETQFSTAAEHVAATGKQGKKLQP